MDNKTRHQLETELPELIDQYLKIALPKKSIDDGIAAAAYYLLGSADYPDCLFHYVQCCVSALATLAKGEVAAHFKKDMVDRDYETLCDLLKRMVEFCRTVE